MVGIFLHGAPHATGVIRNDASDRARCGASGIRSEPATVPLQHRVDVAENHPGACPDASAVILHFAAIPVTAYIDQNVVG
jgi:hypothetical protein